jgi:hypothetical protein
MRTIVLSIVSVTLVAAAASAIGAAPDQTTITPGQMTQARVWVQNHGVGEAVPVDIRGADLDTSHALRVRVVNGETSSGVLALRAQLTASVWDYRTLTLKADQQPARELAQAGAEGWETTGLAWPAGDGGTLLLLKRPR